MSDCFPLKIILNELIIYINITLNNNAATSYFTATSYLSYITITLYGAVTSYLAATSYLSYLRSEYKNSELN